MTSQADTIREGLLILRAALDPKLPLRFDSVKEKDKAENKARRAIALALELLEEKESKQVKECERVAYNKESWYCLTHNQLEERESE